MIQVSSQLQKLQHGDRYIYFAVPPLMLRKNLKQISSCLFLFPNSFLILSEL